MKILWIAQRDLHHDLNTSTWVEMCKSLVQRGHQVMLIALSTSKERYPNFLPNFTIREIRGINHFPMVAITFHLQIIIFSLYWLFSIRPDVIITHPITALFLFPAKILAKLSSLNIKFVLDVRTLPVRLVSLNDKIKNALNYFSISTGKIYFNGFTVITPTLQRLIEKQFHIDPLRIGIWMSGVNTSLFQPKNKESDSDKDSFTVMYHGVLAENRGLFETIKAMVYVNKIVPNINLFILGKGLVLDQMIELVNQLELKTCVHFHEAVNYNEIPDYISKADVGIVPLPDELCWQVSSPLKLLEYLAMAKPVIVSPIEAHTSVLNNFPAAIFLNSTSPEDISDGIIRAYNIRNRLCKFGIEGRKFVTENFTWNLQASKLEKFITNL